MDEPPAVLLAPTALEAPSDEAINDAALLPVVLLGPAEEAAREDTPTAPLDCVAEDAPPLCGGPEVTPKDPPCEEDVPVAETAPDDPPLELVDPPSCCAVQPPRPTIMTVAAVLHMRREMNMVCAPWEALALGSVDAATLRRSANRGFSLAARGLCGRATEGVLRHWEDVLAWWFAVPPKGTAHHDAPVC